MEKPNFASIRAAMDAGEWQRAIALAARLTDLGAERKPILDAHGAYTNPRFLLQIGRDPEALKAAGAEAMQRHFARHTAAPAPRRAAMGMAADVAPRIMQRRSRAAPRGAPSR